MYSYYGLAEFKIGHFVVYKNNPKVNTLKSISKILSYFFSFPEFLQLDKNQNYVTFPT